MATGKPLGRLFADADRWLRHWQLVAGLGRPAEWLPLACDPSNYPEMLSRIAQVGGTFAGTEQHVDMLELAALLRAPAIDVPKSEPRTPEPVDAEEPEAAAGEEMVEFDVFSVPDCEVDVEAD